MGTVYEGTVLTVDKDDSVAKYLVEDDGRICYVGNELPTQYAGWRRLELGSKALCPSFVDTHQHMASFAAFNAGLNVMDARSNAEIVERVREFAAHSDDKTLIAFGASPYSVSDGRLVSRGELDDACPDKPLMLVKYDGHACIVNSALLEKVRGKVSELRGYHPDTGEMNQEAFFAVSDFITSSISIPKLVRNVQRTMDYLAARGIGMVHTVSGVGFSGDLDISLEVWLARSAQSGFQMRVFPQSMDISVAKKRGLLCLRAGRVLWLCRRCAQRAVCGHRQRLRRAVLQRRAGCGVLQGGKPRGVADRDARDWRQGVRPGDSRPQGSA